MRSLGFLEHFYTWFDHNNKERVCQDLRRLLLGNAHANRGGELILRARYDVPMDCFLDKACLRG